MDYKIVNAAEKITVLILKMRQVWGRSVWQLRSNCATSNLLVVLCLFAIFSAVSGQDSCSVGPCYPSPSDISKYFNVTANSTCGNPSEPYCVNLDCTNVCNAFDDNLAHNASLVKDDFSKNTFWKSKKLRVSCGSTARGSKNFHAVSVCGYFLSRVTGCNVPFEVK